MNFFDLCRVSTSCLRCLLLVVVTLGSAKTIFAIMPERARDERPNIVLIIADDMNWDDCGAYGHPSIRTPNIDQLAAQGVQFQHAYLTCSSCSPSRSSIITGRYPHNTGAEQLHWPLPAGSVTFVSQLKEAGYYTASAGKWHLGNEVRTDFDKVYEASTAGFVLPSGNDNEPAKMVAKQPSGCEDWAKALAGCPQEQPYFLWLAALDPHREYEEGALSPPHQTSDVLVPPHLPDTPEVRKDLRLYYDEIGRLDRYVGQLLAQIEQRGETDNTCILFISDNGRPFPRDKTTLYDGGIRTPFLVRWPAKVPAGVKTDSLVSTVDLAPTFLELARLSVDKSAGWEGQSFASVLADPTQAHRTFAFAEDHWHDYEDHGRSVMTTQFKLIRNDYVDLPNTPPADAGRGFSWQAMRRLEQQQALPETQRGCFAAPRAPWELFDLQRDPHELHNLANDPAYASVLSDLKQALAKWSSETGDYLPSRRTPDEFDRQTGEPDHSVRVRPRKSKLEMFGTNGAY